MLRGAGASGSGSTTRLVELARPRALPATLDLVISCVPSQPLDCAVGASRCVCDALVRTL